VYFILVSYMCQYQDTAGTWHQFDTPPSTSKYNANSSGTGYYTVRPCDSLPSGNWYVRGQADGYWKTCDTCQHNTYSPPKIYTTKFQITCG